MRRTPREADSIREQRLGLVSGSIPRHPVFRQRNPAVCEPCYESD